MDYEMPRMNGPTAASVLRDMGCKVPVIGITGNVLAEDKEFFKSHGVVEVLTKPLTLSQLENTINELNANVPKEIFESCIIENGIGESAGKSSKSTSFLHSRVSTPFNDINAVPDSEV
jgi:DNA-binding response OmpR family regulator